MTIRHLRVFVAVCEEGSITKAGQRLFMAQPTVSFIVSELEKYYDTKLFDRISKRLHLTDAGRKLLTYAQHIISMFDKMEEEIREWNSSGTMRIGSSITIGNCLLPGLLKDFKKARPGVSVNIQVDNSGKIEQSVLNNSIDFGLIEGMSHSSLIVSEPFRDDELVLVFAPEHPWAEQQTVKAAELKGEPLLLREKGSGGREILESALLLHNIEIEPTWESSSTQAIIQAVAKGLGVAVLPMLLVENYIAQGALITRPIEGISLKRKFMIIYHKNKFLTDIAKDFIELCCAENSTDRAAVIDGNLK